MGGMIGLPEYTFSIEAPREYRNIFQCLARRQPTSLTNNLIPFTQNPSRLANAQSIKRCPT